MLSGIVPRTKLFLLWGRLYFDEIGRVTLYLHRLHPNCPGVGTRTAAGGANSNGSVAGKAVFTAPRLFQMQRIFPLPSFRAAITFETGCCTMKQCQRLKSTNSSRAIPSFEFAEICVTLRSTLFCPSRNNQENSRSEELTAIQVPAGLAWISPRPTPFYRMVRAMKFRFQLMPV